MKPLTALRQTALALLMAGLLAGCAQTTMPACPASSGMPMRVFQLFFGEGIQGRADLTEAEWAQFAADSITPVLPDGFTVIDGTGQWLSPADHHIGREKTKILLVALADNAASRAKIDQLRAAYQQRFSQESVGLVSTAGCGSFD
jgi:hypothetical protein